MRVSFSQSTGGSRCRGQRWPAIQACALKILPCCAWNHACLQHSERVGHDDVYLDDGDDPAYKSIGPQLSLLDSKRKPKGLHVSFHVSRQQQQHWAQRRQQQQQQKANRACGASSRTCLLRDLAMPAAGLGCACHLSAWSLEGHSNSARKHHTVKGAGICIRKSFVHQSAKHVGGLASTPVPTHSHAVGACLTAFAEPDLHGQRQCQGLLQMAAAGAAGQCQRLLPAH